MPIKKGSTGIGSIYKGTTAIASVYKGYDLVFESWKTLTTQGIPPLTINKCKNVNMLGYKVYGNSKQQLLPDGYTQLEYIESTGTQYIDTGINPDRTSRFELNFIQTTHNTSIMGAYSDTNNRVQAFRGAISGADSSFFEFRVFSGTSHTDYSNVLYSNNTKLNVVFDIKNLKGTVNGNVVNLTDMGGGNISYPVWLFCANNAGSIATASNSKLYSYEHYKNDILIQKLVPCKNSSNVVGLYDIVNGVFHQNAGTGTFTAGAVAPTPNAPIEIESVGDKTKNLWDSTLIAGCMKFADGQYLNYPGYVCNATPISVEAGQTYTISANNYNDPEQTSTGFVFYNNGTFVSSLITTSLTVTIPTGVNQLYYNFRKQSSSSSLSPSDITNVQLEKGSTATSYEPYGYNIPITVSSINLLDIFGRTEGDAGGSGATNTRSFDYSKYYLGFSGNNYYYSSYISNLSFVNKEITFTSSSVNYGVSFPVKVEPNTTYTISGETIKLSGNNYNLAISYYDVNGDYLSFDRRSLTFTTPNNCVTANIILLAEESNVSYTHKNIQLELGNASHSYEPYVAPRTTNIYLDEPLRKIGNYNDYIDFETQKVYRNIGHIDLGNPTYTYQSQYTRFRSDTISGLKIITGNWTYDLKCDVYGTTLAQNFNIGAQGGALFIWDNRYADGTALKNALTGHYLDYALENQTEESITLPDILLNKGTNIVEIDTDTTPSNVWIKYEGKS